MKLFAEFKVYNNYINKTTNKLQKSVNMSDRLQNT